MSSFNSLIKLYDKLIKPKPYENLLKLDGPIVYYNADSDNVELYADSVWSIDIVSAFPTICNMLYKNKKDFLNRLNSIKEKKAKNIFISTTLHNKELKKLNLCAKLIICGLFLQLFPDSVIFELKKDGLLIQPGSYEEEDGLEYLKNTRSPIELITTPFTKFLQHHKFEFHVEYYDYYVRSRKTSYYFDINREYIDIKGMYKKRPKYVQDLSKRLIQGIEIDTQEIDDIYSDIKYEIIKTANLEDFLKYYYYCGDQDVILNKKGKYVRYSIKTADDLHPANYIHFFILPIVEAMIRWQRNYINSH